jgi:hypothetical protein
MLIGSGARLGPYVLGPALGSGGMGEVYLLEGRTLRAAIECLPLPGGARTPPPVQVSAKRSHGSRNLLLRGLPALDPARRLSPFVALPPIAGRDGTRH